MLIDLKATLPNGAKRLQQKFDVTRKDLSEIYLLPVEVCMETFLRDFQFKFLNNITCTNILLKKLGKVDSVACSVGCRSSGRIRTFILSIPLFTSILDRL